MPQKTWQQLHPRDWPLPFSISYGPGYRLTPKEEIAALWRHRDGHFLLRQKTQPLRKKIWLLISSTREVLLDITCNANKIAPPLRDANKFLDNDTINRKKIGRRVVQSS